MTTRRSLAGGAAIMAVSRASVAVTGSLTTLLIARLLGPSGAGAFAVALTVVLVVMVAGSLGVEHGIAYFVSARQWAARHAFASSTRIGLLTGAVGAGLVIAVRLAAPSAFGGLTVAETAVVAAGMPFALVWYFTSWVGLAVDHYEMYGALPAVLSGASLLLVGILAAISDLSGAVLGLALGEALTAVVAVAWARRVLPRTEPAAERRGMARRAVGFGVKSYGANALQFVNFRLDLFILSAATGAVAVGHYAVAVSFSTVLLLLPQAMSEVLFPRVAALSSDALHDERAMVERKSLRHVALLCLVVGGALAVALVVLVVPLYGARFRASIDLGLILLPGVALLGLAGTLNASIVGRGHPEIALRIAAITTPVTVALYVILIPAMDATGAALASTLSYAATFVLALHAYGRLTDGFPVGAILPTRAELRDYLALLRAARVRLGGPAPGG